MANKKTPEQIENIQDHFENLKVDGDSYLTLLTRKHRMRKPYVAPDPKKIIAFIPGNVKEVLVKKGDKVQKGQLLCILEAMKMNNELIAPFDASVKSVNVKEGEHVVKSDVLIELK